MADSVLNTLRKTVESFDSQPLNWKKRYGGTIIGWLKSDVPEELIHASGCLPVGIHGGKAGLDRVEAHLQPWACSLMRSSLALALEGRLDFLDGLIIPHTCDTTRMLSGIWKHVRPFPFMENFLLPRQVDRPSARAYMLAEMSRLKKSLEYFTGRTISEDGLRDSIALYNKNRRLLMRLFDLHGQSPWLIGCRDLYTAVRASMLMPKGLHNLLLEQLLSGLETPAGEQGRSEEEKPRVVVSGPVWEPPEIMDIIESQGTVAGDDMLTGYRYFADCVPEDGDPLEALAQRQLARIPFASFDSADSPRRRFLVELARQKKARGVIFLHLKYCEPENFDYHDNRQALEAAGIPSLRIETEVGAGPLEQVRTRVEAFLEMLGGSG